MAAKDLLDWDMSVQVHAKRDATRGCGKSIGIAAWLPLAPTQVEVVCSTAKLPRTRLLRKENKLKWKMSEDTALSRSTGLDMIDTDRADCDRCARENSQRTCK